jgi:5'-nucleotidase
MKAQCVAAAGFDLVTGRSQDLAEHLALVLPGETGPCRCALAGRRGPGRSFERPCIRHGATEKCDLVVVAPDRNHSGASNSLTLHSPLRVHEVAKDRYFVTGTPSDCVHLALSGLFDEDPDIVISGINHGANLGDDVIYSGTVAAAMEGRYLGLPAIAVSLVGQRPTHFEAAASIVVELLDRLGTDSLPDDILLNVNVPDLPREAIRGIEATRLGFRHRSEPMVRTTDPQGREIYWIGPAGPGQDAGPGTDFHAIEQGRVAVSPIKIDLTRHESLPRLKEWLSG